MDVFPFHRDRKSDNEPKSGLTKHSYNFFMKTNTSLLFVLFGHYSSYEANIIEVFFGFKNLLRSNC